MNLRRLQRLINVAAEANTKAFHATKALNDFCDQEYGCSPSDIDADEIIDGVLGGNGTCDGMWAARFDQIMREGRPE